MACFKKSITVGEAETGLTLVLCILIPMSHVILIIFSGIRITTTLMTQAHERPLYLCMPMGTCVNCYFGQIYTP